jgi:ubiquinone/menaquinone biosynthesis C-methylase UbiE
MSLETINFDLIGLRPGDKVLDLGCGEGRHTISSYLLADVDVIGLDLSRQDLTTAKQRLNEFQQGQEPPSKSCSFVCGSGLQLPFKNDSFDKVICAEVLEHIPDYQAVLDEIRRVLKPGGIFATSVPRWFPEWVCWRLSDEYHAVEGGHVRIFTASELRGAVERTHMRRYARHWAHSLHVPYWWLRCLLWSAGQDAKPVQAYHRFLVWDLMNQPLVTRVLDRLLNPLMGKSIVMYFVNEL